MRRARGPVVFATCAMVALLIGLTPCARADLFTLDLGIGNSSGTPPLSSFPGPYATVTVDRTDPLTATITFTSLTNNGNIYLMGGTQAADVNVNASSWVVGVVNGTNSGTGFTPGPFSNGGPGVVNGFGAFNQTINDSDGFQNTADHISFTLSNTSGTFWTSASNVLTPNANGFLAAAHIFVTSFPANASTGALTTGFAAGPVPEPSSLILFGLGVFALAIMMRRHLLPATDDSDERLAV